MTEELHTESATADVERAVAFVRMLIAVATAAILLSTRSAGSLSDLAGGALFSGAILAEAVALSWVLQRIDGSSSRSKWVVSLVQMIDTLWFVELTIVLSGTFQGAAWVLLVLPVVIASLRVSAMRVFGVWALASGGYLAAIWARLIDGEASSIDWATPLQQTGLLLMVAACVALLARWLQEGWIAQAHLAAEADGRLAHVRTIERAARDMRDLDAKDVMRAGVEHVVRLGFAAGSVTRGTTFYAATGVGGLVARGVELNPPAPDTVEITRWIHATGTVRYSASVLEEESRTAITGWDTSEISEARAEALSDLVANISGAVRAARYMEKIRHAATHDPLTGLRNRTEIFRHLDDATSSGEPVAVLFVDLDHFKAVNDLYGHQVGDAVLVHIGRRLERAIDGVGMVGRYGGDEFVIVTSGAAAVAAEELTESLLAAMRAPFEIEGHYIAATFSIGAAVSSGSVEGKRLLEAADSAVYGAKADGRNSARIVSAGRGDVLKSEPALTDGVS